MKYGFAKLFGNICKSKFSYNLTIIIFLSCDLKFIKNSRSFWVMTLHNP